MALKRPGFEATWLWSDLPVRRLSGERDAE